jgi:DnaJ-class molecular chaperone
MPTCESCRGFASIPCPDCKGTGHLTELRLPGFKAPECLKCNGYGTISCPACKGLGLVES